MALQSYKDLEVWKKSIGLVSAVYKLSKQLPSAERFGLSSQMQRAAVSIPSNIAEGYARKGTGEYIQFLSIAFGSAAELETQLIISAQQYPNLDISNTAAVLTEVQKMLYVLMKKLNPKP